MGLLVGIFAGLALALVTENLDTKLYTTGPNQSTVKLPTIGRIPLFHERSSSIVVTNSQNGNRPQFEAFRLLRINLLSWHKNGDPHQVLLVTSADAGEGKSTVSLTWQ
ncbi:MAG: hypothetical protein R2867_36325 [Caldilineaceae bacterium]